MADERGQRKEEREGMKDAKIKNKMDVSWALLLSPGRLTFLFPLSPFI
jgi:hypothetical protein